MRKEENMRKTREKGGKGEIYKREYWLIFIFQLDLLLKDASGGDTTSFVKNGEWDLIGAFFIEGFDRCFYNKFDCVKWWKEPGQHLQNIWNSILTSSLFSWDIYEIINIYVCTYPILTIQSHELNSFTIW